MSIAHGPTSRMNLQGTRNAGAFARLGLVWQTLWNRFLRFVSGNCPFGGGTMTPGRRQLRKRWHIASVVVVGALALSSAIAQPPSGSTRSPGADALDIGDCPMSAKDLPPEKDFTCHCSGQLYEGYDGQVWGTYIYGNTSNICNAAIHAGVIQKGKPGQVSIHFVPIPPVLRGTTQNGVKTLIFPRPPQNPPFQLGPGE
jgi:hypothetical protein